MPQLLRLAPASLALLTTLTAGQGAMTLNDLDSQGRVTLSKEELVQLLPGAGMSRVNASGSEHFWKNDLDGIFIVTSDNKGQLSKGSRAHGKWHISDDGRYCVRIDWKRSEPEDWCRYIVKAGGAFYATKSDKVGAERVYKLDISK